MTYISAKTLTFEEFVTQYGDNPRYEEIIRANLKWIIPKNCFIKPPAAEATALRPDVDDILPK